MAEITEEIELRRRSNYLQRYQMELSLETMPREVYSNKLMESMRREEVAVRDDKLTQHMIQSINEMLRNETQKFYAKITNSNIKRWNTFNQKLNQENTTLDLGGGGVNDEGEKTDPGADNSTGDGSAGTKVSASGDDEDVDLEAELYRLEEDYNKNWIGYEGSNLRCAFKNQLERVEVDWATHEDALTEDFNRRKISEKMGHNRMKESTAQKQFSISMENLQKQKEAAKRWMYRQELRLQTQAQEIHREREAISAFIRDQILAMKPK
jgi:hypothetical protein